MHRLLVIAAVGLTACLDVAVPPPPGPGAITGRVVFTPPGRSQPRPAAGATITLLGSGVSLLSTART